MSLMTILFSEGRIFINNSRVRENIYKKGKGNGRIYWTDRVFKISLRKIPIVRYGKSHSWLGWGQAVSLPVKNTLSTIYHMPDATEAGVESYGRGGFLEDNFDPPSERL